MPKKHQLCELMHEQYVITDDDHLQRATLLRQPVPRGHEEPYFQISMDTRWATAKEWRQFLTLCMEQIDRLAPPYDK